jgi:hypothetical protein
VAVRITSAAQAYTRAISLGTLTAWSITCWLKISVDTNAQTIIWAIDTGSVFGDRYLLRTDSNGTTVRPVSDLGTHGSRALTVGVWYFVAVALHPDGGRLVSCADGDTGFTTTTYAAFGQSTAAANLRIGKNADNGEVLNGCIAGFKFWTATLSQEEIEAEAAQYLPARTDDLYAFYPLIDDADDESGNGNTLSGGTGATWETGPDIPWGAEAVTGDLAAVLPSLTAEASGTATITGQQSAVLPSLTGSLAATAAVQGEVNAALPAFTASMVGEVGAPGLLTAVLPALTGQLDGLLTGGFLTAQLPALTGTAQGELAVQGVAPVVLPPLTASLTGVAEIPHNNLDVTVGPPYRGWAARSADTAWAADATAAGWQAGSPATTWTPSAPDRGWKARQPTT